MVIYARDSTRGLLRLSYESVIGAFSARYVTFRARGRDGEAGRHANGRHANGYHANEPMQIGPGGAMGLASAGPGAPAAPYAASVMPLSRTAPTGQALKQLPHSSQRSPRML